MVVFGKKHAKGRKRNKSHFATKFVELKLQLFSYDNISEIASGIFATESSFADHLELKTVNEITCPQQILANCMYIS